MADAELKVRIDAEIGGLQAGLKQAEQAVNSGSTNINNSVGKIQGSFTILNNTKFTFGQNFTSASNQVANQATKTGQVLGTKLSAGANQAGFALTNLGRVAQDAPFGFIGIQNNLNPLLESFQQLKQQTGSTGAAFKALGQSLIGPAGIGIALSVVSAGILLYQQYQQKAKKVTEESTKSFKDQKDEFLKSPYEKSIIELNDLTTKIGLAKQGFLDKKEVLKQYNESIGKTIGKVNDLNTAEQNIIDNGDKYLQLMLLKAKAEFAFKKAAEQSYEIAKKQNEIDVNKNPLNLDPKALESLKKLGQVKPTAIQLQTQFDEKTELKKLNTLSNRATTIAKSAQQEVIDFAKASGFNLNGIFDVDTEKSNKDFKTTKDVLSDLDLELRKIKNAVDGTFGDAEKDKIGAFKKAIDGLTESGASESVIKNVQAQALNIIEPLKAIEKPVETLGVATATSLGTGFASAGSVIATNFNIPLKKGLSDWQVYVNSELLPQVEGNFKAFFDKILMDGEISFKSLGQAFKGLGSAIINTLLSIVASDAAKQFTNLLSVAEPGVAKKGAGGIFGALGGLFKVGGKAAVGTAATGGTAAVGTAGAAAGGSLLLPILGGLAAGALIASLFKKKPKSEPAPPPVANYATSGYSGFTSGSDSGRVVFEISGTNLIGVLNRAGAKLQRYGG